MFVQNNPSDEKQTEIESVYGFTKSGKLSLIIAKQLVFKFK